MTDLEISKALALAIGWPTNDVQLDNVAGYDAIYVFTGYQWQEFNYFDWNVIGPIAERFDCFPYKNYAGNQWGTDVTLGWHDTPQKAGALAVIQGAGK